MKNIECVIKKEVENNFNCDNCEYRLWNGSYRSIDEPYKWPQYEFDCRLKNFLNPNRNMFEVKKSWSDMMETCPFREVPKT